MAIFEGPQGERFTQAAVVAAWLLAAFLAVQTLAGLTGLRYIGSGVQATNTITISGHGEAFAVPDIATFSFSIVSDKPTVSAAQTDVTAKINAMTDYLKSAGVDEKDIQTSDYSVYPQYEYENGVCPMGAPVSSGGATTVYCPPGKQVLKGYEVRQTTTVKVRDTAKAGDLLAGVGGKGATEVSGLNFTFDDPTAVQNDARNKAIADAKSKADALAKQLGVSIVRVVSFNENTSGYPIYTKSVAYGMGAADSAVAAPQISTGQNKVSDDVSVTYEIR
jgi:uncharacterized protein YggE